MKKLLTASSVWGEVGLAAMLVEEREATDDEPADEGWTGWCSSRNLTLLGVTKQDMYELKKRSTCLRYLCKTVSVSLLFCARVAFILGRERLLHLAGPPLHLLYYVERRVHDELIHVPRLLAEARLPVPALLRGPELVLEQRVVLRPDDDEVV